MNEQIKQLAVKAGFPEWSHKTVGFELEQFAELMVRECASQVRFTDLLKCNDDSDGEILLQASVQLKQHFGVEL
jgi:hypothetical protein